MQIPFKLESGAPTDAEVQHSNFKKFYPEINHALAWDELTPYIEQAVDTYMLPYIGQTLYDEVLEEYHTDEAGMSAKQKRFMELLQRAAAYYTILHALPKKLGVLASMGAVNNTPSGGAAPMSQWSYKNQLWSITRDADTFLDALLDYLQKDVNTGSNEFEDWKNSDAYTEGKSDLFRSTGEFGQFHDIARSHRTFLAIVPYVQKAARKYILPILGQVQYDNLVSGLKENDLSTEEKALLDKVRACLAEYAIFMAIPNLACIIEADGMKVVSSTDGMDTRGNAASAFYKEVIDKHQCAAEDAGRTFRIDLIEHLYAKADVFPDWKDSDFYKQGSAASCNVIGSQTGGVWI